MTYRSMLLYLDRDPQCETRTRAAIKLAKRLDCHIAGVAPTGLIDLPVAPTLEVGLGNLSTLVLESLRNEAEAAAQKFRDACHAAGFKSFEVVVDESDKAQSVVRHARCSDLTLLSQADPSAPDHRATGDLVEQTVLYSARPTLIIPYVGYAGAIGTHALVAWDDSRESARAVADALPLLAHSRRVEIISWDEHGIGDSTLRPRLDALRQWLAWHGVTAEVHIESTRIDVGNALLSRAADLDADLIVMGAYGHARWTERVLGGATRRLLDSMTVPVLMSH